MDDIISMSQAISHHFFEGIKRVLLQIAGSLWTDVDLGRTNPKTKTLPWTMALPSLFESTIVANILHCIYIYILLSDLLSDKYSVY